MKRLTVKLSDAGKARLDKLAQLQQRTTADVVRTALSNYLHDLGIDVDVEPEIGWGKGRKKEQVEPET